MGSPLERGRGVLAFICYNTPLPPHNQTRPLSRGEIMFRIILLHGNRLLAIFTKSFSSYKP